VGHLNGRREEPERAIAPGVVAGRERGRFVSGG
jgi:hypothetical protein